MTQLPIFSGVSGKRSRGVLRMFAMVQITFLLYASGAQFVFAQAGGTESFGSTQDPRYTRGAGDVTPDAAPLPAITPSQEEPQNLPGTETLPEEESQNESAPLSEPSFPATEGDESQPPAGDASPGEESPSGAGTLPEPPYSSVQPVPASYQIKPDVDQSTGALTYRYPFTLPPGRNGMTPELSLAYNSQDRRDGSLVGFGWSISFPAIERQNLTGIRNLFTDEHFTSSLSGELVRTTAGETPNNFAARTDDGSFVRYTFTANAWTAKTKDGTTYSFGSTGASRLFDANGDPNKVARWFLDRIEDTNGNRIDFTYVRDTNQAYLDTIRYTDTAAGNGPFLVTFVRELRPEADRHILYANGFKTETRYRVSEIQTRVSNELTSRYALSYTQSPANNRSLLRSITETGYGDTGAPVVLPPTSFAYTPDSMSFANNGPNPFVTVAPLVDSSLRFGYLVVDVNGDGYTDLVRSHEKSVGNPPISTTDRRVWLNDHNGALVESMTWTGTSTLPTICIEDDSFNCRGRGAALSDANGDLFTDYYWSDGGGARLGVNTGSGWQSVPVGAGYSLIPTYSYRPIMASYDGANPPYAIEVNVGGSYGTLSNLGNRVVDVNHDGLPDAVRSAGSLSETNGLDEGVYANSGTNPITGIVGFEGIGWQFLNGVNIGANAPAANAFFEHDRGSKGSFLADINGDDLPDVVTADNRIYRHMGNGWIFSNALSLGVPYQEMQLADMNGDGLLDLIISDSCGRVPGACGTRVLYHTGQVPDLLQTITLPAGGTVTAAYKASPSYKDASGALLNPTLPMAIQTVERITETDPVAGVSGVTSYEYAGGKYFFENLTNRRFAGFARVAATKPDGSKAVTYFTVAEDGKIGKPFRTDLLDAAGNPVQRTFTGWTVTPRPALGGNRFFTVPETTVTFDFGASGHRDRATRSTYDMGTGAILTTFDYGEVDADAATSTPVFTDLGNDARATTYTYAVNNNGLELPATQTLTDYAGVTISQTRTYYDTLPLGEVSIGNRTKEERLIDAVANTYAATQWTYAPTGLVQTEIDPLNHVTQFVYDTLGLYPVAVTNALNQQTTYAYDYTNGKPVTVTDPNNELRRTVYDGLDRVVEEWKPYPVTGVSTLIHMVRYTDQPNQVAVHEEFIDERPLVTDSYTYLDGFGRVIQKRERAEGTSAGGFPAYTAADTTYDNQGRVNSVSLPYASPDAARTQPVVSPLLTTVYQYDATGRVVNVADIVGTTRAVYDKWDAMMTDSNSHEKRFARDASGRLIRVEELMSAGTSPYITSYAYDAAGNLANITDADGNVRHFTYDNLGRRLTAEDLHASSDTTFGVYSFVYDAAGNLVRKQTPKAETVVYAYDALNRETTEDLLSTPGAEVTYVYDTCARGIGRRCGETTAGASRAFTYNLAGNAATEIATVNSVPYTTSYAYDQLGNVTRVTHPDGSAMITTLNEGGRTETVSWQANAAAIPTSLVTNFDYAPHGAVAKIERGNGIEETFRYDIAAKYRLLEHVVGPLGSGAPPANSHAIDLEDSSSQYLSAANSVPLSITGDMTIELWANLESQPASGQSFTFASKFLPPARISFFFDYENNGGAPRLRFAPSMSGGPAPAASVNYELSTGAWHHLAVVYTAASGRAEFFVDGASVGSGSGLATSIFRSSEPFFIGTRTDPGPTRVAFFNGKIDDMRVWATARTRMQIVDNKDRELPWIEPGLRAYWKFANDLDDASGNNNTLSNPANALFVTDVPFAGGSGAPPSAAPLSRRAYSYDAVGNVLSIVEVQDACPAAQPCGATTTSNYIYDPLDRLTQGTVTTETATSTSQTVSNYSYGATGNLLSSPAGKYAYTDINTAVSFSNPQAAIKVGSRTLSYDTSGNLTSDTSDSMSVINSWSYRNELTYTALKTAGVKKSISYGYDSAGMRVSLRESEAGGMTATYFLTSAYSETINPDNSVERTVSIEAAGMPLATIRTVGTSTPEVFATHTDHLRSTRFVTSETTGQGNGATVVESTDYDAFGKIVKHEQSGDFSERHKFTGHEYDDSTNYTYAKARYLETNFGRFLSEDPAFVEIGNPRRVQEITGHSMEEILMDPQLLNSYSYVKNNPIKLTDPTGKFAMEAAALGGSAILAPLVAPPVLIAAAIAVGVIAVVVGTVEAVKYIERRNDGLRQVDPLPLPDLGIPNPPLGPEDVIPNLKPDLPKWVKWFIGGTITATAIKEYYDKYKEIEESGEDFEEGAQSTPINQNGGSGQNGSNSTGHASSNYLLKTYGTPNGTIVDWYGNIISAPK